MTSSSHTSSSSSWYARSWRFPAVAFLLSCCLGYFSWFPLFHTDLWGHLSFGRLIWNTGELPLAEPFLIKPEETPVLDSAWLIQVAGYLVEEQGGATALQFAYGLMMTLILGIFGVTHFKLTGRFLVGVLAVGLFLWLEWKQLVIIRPQLIGVLFYVWLWCRLQFPTTAGLVWVLPPMMLVWANSHGSFIMGTGLVCCMTLGRALDLYREAGQFPRFWQDQEWKLLMLCSVLVITTPLINPYGLDLYLNVLSFSENPNLYSLIEWKPLSLNMFQGKAAACCGGAMLLLWCFSPRKLKAAEILLLLVLGYVTLKTSRMIIWLAPVMATQVVLHLTAVWEKYRGAWQETTFPRKAGYTWLGTGLLLLGGLATPAACAWWKTIPIEESVSSRTPVGIARYLNAQEENGNLLNTMAWGDYLIWSSEGNQPVFVYSHVHLIPRKVWTDYLSIMRCLEGWEKRLDRYQIETIAVENRSRRKKLIEQLKQHEQWQEVYRDRLGYVFKRTAIPLK